MNLLEKSLIEHCSPTLASLKTANLFNYSYRSEQELEEDMKRWNREMNPKGIFLTILRQKKDRVLVYVYRPGALERVFRSREVREFLRKYGYDGQTYQEALGKLRRRLQEQEEFPHEIGIFLGYPLADVTGFIENAGKNFLCAGVWKVYADKEETQRKFAKYKKCTEIYIHLWKKGKSIKQLTVAA